jgi:hypothetical protein
LEVLSYCSVLYFLHCSSNRSRRDSCSSSRGSGNGGRRSRSSEGALRLSTPSEEKRIVLWVSPSIPIYTNTHLVLKLSTVETCVFILAYSYLLNSKLSLITFCTTAAAAAPPVRHQLGWYPGQKHVLGAIFVDLEPTIINEVRTGTYRASSSILRNTSVVTTPLARRLLTCALTASASL